MSLSTFVIDYPEARCIAAHLNKTHGVCVDAIWEPFGYRPETMRARMRPIAQQPFIVINGSGLYHHETYALVQSLCRFTDCAYVHVDAHADKDTFFRWKLDCASFVGGIVEHRQVSEGVLLGIHVTPDLHDVPGVFFGNELAYYRVNYFEQLRLYTARPADYDEAHFRYTRADGVAARRNTSVHKALAAPLRKNRKRKTRALLVRWKDLSVFDPASLNNPQVYLSIDLDVLRKAVVSDWRRARPGHQTEISLNDVLGVRVRSDIPEKKHWTASIGDNQGDLSLQELLSLIRYIGNARRIVGADICGLTRFVDQLPKQHLHTSLDAIARIYQALCNAMA